MVFVGISGVIGRSEKIRRVILIKCVVVRNAEKLELSGLFKELNDE